LETVVTGLFDEPEDATPLEPIERDGLLQSWIVNRSELNEAEQENIVKGAAWAKRARIRKVEDLLTADFIRTLHKRMFNDVWAWAGDYRQTERNIGIETYRIPIEVRTLGDDVRYWIAHQTYSPDEIAIRFHHMLVVIHPFPNGNGRLTRLIADLLIERLGRDVFTWGGNSLGDAGVLRASYIAALKKADNGVIDDLVAFARR
jgi:Fic-DOC domain mobile mystery protein B